MLSPRRLHSGTSNPVPEETEGAKLNKTQVFNLRKTPKGYEGITSLYDGTRVIKLPDPTPRRGASDAAQRGTEGRTQPQNNQIQRLPPVKSGSHRDTPPQQRPGQSRPRYAGTHEEPPAPEPQRRVLSGRMTETGRITEGAPESGRAGADGRRAESRRTGGRASKGGNAGGVGRTGEGRNAGGISRSAGSGGTPGKSAPAPDKHNSREIDNRSKVPPRRSSTDRPYDRQQSKPRTDNRGQARDGRSDASNTSARTPDRSTGARAPDRTRTPDRNANTRTPDRSTVTPMPHGSTDPRTPDRKRKPQLTPEERRRLAAAAEARKKAEQEMARQRAERLAELKRNRELRRKRKRREALRFIGRELLRGLLSAIPWFFALIGMTAALGGIAGAIIFIDLNTGSSTHPSEVEYRLTDTDKNEIDTRTMPYSSTFFYGEPYIGASGLASDFDLTVAGDGRRYKLITEGGRILEISVGSSAVVLDGTPVRLSTPVCDVGGEVFLPLELARQYITGISAEYSSEDGIGIITVCREIDDYTVSVSDGKLPVYSELGFIHRPSPDLGHIAEDSLPEAIAALTDPNPPPEEGDGTAAGDGGQ